MSATPLSHSTINMSLNIASGGSDEAARIKSQKESVVRPKSLKGIRFVIFPENHLVQLWDFIMILVIWYYSFYIPFHICISGGYYAAANQGFTIFTFVVNMTFFGKLLASCGFL